MNQHQSRVKSWLRVPLTDTSDLESALSAKIKELISSGSIPGGEIERVACVDTAITRRDAFIVTAERLEILRGLCHLYSAGIRAEEIRSHRPWIGPVIVFFKKAIFRVISALLGPTFQYQRQFNAGVIRLLGDLANQAAYSSEQRGDNGVKI
jgi:hypothetical protein